MKHLLLPLGICIATAVITSQAAAAIVLGQGTGALRGGDLTDPENDGDPESNFNYNAVFNASEEPMFGGAEAAFNVFDNQVGGGAAKWCCGDQNNFPVNPIWVQATFSQPIVLSEFTLASGNDTPGRDPVDWQIQGSNDGILFTPIFTKTGPGTLWTERDQVISWSSAGTDFAMPPAYSTIRLNVTATGLTTGARFQLSEFEIFGAPVPEPSSISLLAAGAVLAVRRRRPAPRP